MFPLLLLLFIGVPLLELALLLWVGGKIGVVATIALVVVTGALGAGLARWQGLATLDRFRRRLAAGELPHEDLIDGVLILVAAAVLLTPGLITDATGFLLLVPAVRGALRAEMLRRLERRFVAFGAGPGPSTSSAGGSGPVIEAEFVVEPDEQSDAGTTADGGPRRIP